MADGSTVKEKSYQFAIRIVKLYLWLKEQSHYELSSQVLRAGTSIGANIEEASASHSKKSFFTKWESVQRKQEKYIIGFALCEIQGFLARIKHLN